MTWSGTEAEPARPTLPRDRFSRLVLAGRDKLVEAFSSDDAGMRRVAGLELIRRADHVDFEADDPDAMDVASSFMDHYFRLAKYVLDPAHPMAARMQAFAVLNAYDLLLKQPSKNWVRGASDPDARLRRLAYQDLARFPEPDDPYPALSLMLGKEDDPQVRRARAIAAGRVQGLGRGNPGQDAELIAFASEVLRQEKQERDRFQEEQAKLKARGADGDEEENRAANREALSKHLERSKEIRGSWRKNLTSDVVAARLLAMARDDLESDPFLRDGYTRGLEGLGPAAVDALVTAIGSGDPKRSAAALYALQGWRDDDGVSALLATATGKAEIPAPARAGLFRALRELIDSVPPDRVVGWLQQEPKADPATRAEAIRVLAAMHGRALLAAGPILPGLIADPDADVRRAAGSAVPKRQPPRRQEFAPQPYRRR